MSLEKCTWKATLKPGKKAEYIRRHDEIWPEMTEVLMRAGIRNYTIWCCGDELFGYYECEKGAAYAASSGGKPGGRSLERIHARRDDNGFRSRNRHGGRTTKCIFFSRR